MSSGASQPSPTSTTADISSLAAAPGFSLRTTRRVRHAVFCLLSMWLLHHGFRGTTADHEAGDAVEYILMTDALVHHGTPDLRSGDTWNPDAEKRLKKPPQGPRDRLLGFFPALNGRWYSWHFFFYPVLNLPMRAVVALTGQPVVQAFTLTNAILAICVIGQLLYATRYPLGLQIIGAVLYVWSSALWYFSWPHPEVMTCAFVFMSVIAWFHGRCYQSILLSSLATMQNPPLFLLVLFYLLPTLFRPDRRSALNVFLCGITSFWVIVPPLFYRYHFGVGSLIADSNFLDRHMITVTRFWGFFFDLDQGMILSMPVALPLFLYLYVALLVTSARHYYHLLLVPLLIGMTFFFMPMINWNHGQAGINRYASWSSMIPLAYLIELLSPGWNRRRCVLVAVLVAAPQVFIIQHYGGTRVPAKAFLAHKGPALFVLENLPRFYNPDPTIFLARTTGTDRFAGHHTLNSPDSLKPAVPEPDVVPYIGKDGQIRKIAVRQGCEPQLLKYGWSEDDIPIVTARATYVIGWAYLHPGDFQKRKN